MSTCDENSIITQSRSAAVVVVTALLDDGAPALPFCNGHVSVGRARISTRVRRGRASCDPIARTDRCRDVASIKRHRSRYTAGIPVFRTWLTQTYRRSCGPAGISFRGNYKQSDYGRVILPSRCSDAWTASWNPRRRRCSRRVGGSPKIVRGTGPEAMLSSLGHRGSRGLRHACVDVHVVGEEAIGRMGDDGRIAAGARGVCRRARHLRGCSHARRMGRERFEAGLRPMGYLLSPHRVVRSGSRAFCLVHRLQYFGCSKRDV